MVANVKQKPKIQPKPWTLAELTRMFGSIPSSRIRTDPAPGTATVEDVLRVHRREKRLCELVDGVLVEKPMGDEESILAARLIVLLSNMVDSKKLGIVAGKG
jgi:hypothetical protein